MSKKKDRSQPRYQRQTAIASTRPLPFLFTLPDDLQEVKRWAFALGVVNAFHSWPRRPASDNPQFISTAAIEAALRFEKQTIDGKRGSNDLVLFRKTFSDLCAIIHPAMTQLFQRYPEGYQVLKKMSIQERLGRAYQVAGEYLAVVEQLIAEGKPIEFEL